jgi:hypothetical protein
MSGAQLRDDLRSPFRWFSFRNEAAGLRKLSRSGEQLKLLALRLE